MLHCPGRVLIWPGRTTESSRKNVKRKTVCTSIDFHKSLVSSTGSGPELVANLSFTAPRSTTITPRPPNKLAPPICFQALGGCLRPTTDSDTQSTDPK